MPLDDTSPENIVDTAQPVAALPADQAPVAAPAEATPTESTSDEPKSYLEAALQALAPKKPDGEEAAAKPVDAAVETETTQTPVAATDQGESLADVPTLPDAVFKSLPTGVRKTFVDLRKQIKTLKPDAERGAAVADFIRVSGVTPDEFAQLQDVGAMLKRDPLAARKILVGKLVEIDRVMGITLPDDLNQDVENGYISEDRAKELSQTRAKAERAESVLQQRTDQAATNAVLADVSAWETETRRADPDFDRKLPQIEKLVRAAAIEAVQVGKPIRSGIEAIRVARDAYDQVNTMLASFRPAATATRPSPSSAASAPAAETEPKTALEAAMAGLRRGRR